MGDARVFIDGYPSAGEGDVETMPGWMGLVLHIDLTERKVAEVPTGNYAPEKYIGGKGLSSSIFWDIGCPKVSASDPENVLILCTGPLTGIPGPFGRIMVSGVSSLAKRKDCFSSTSLRGTFPLNLKFSGYDGLIITGKADEPVTVSIRDRKVRIEAAGDLWGHDTYETQRLVLEKDPHASILCIGPAGESLVRNAVIASETKTVSTQGSFGAVMGSKNLKAIVARGTGNVAISHPDLLIKFIADRKANGKWLTGAAQAWEGMLGFGENVESSKVAMYRSKLAECLGCPCQCQAFYDVPGIGTNRADRSDWWRRKQDPYSNETWSVLMLSKRMGIDPYDLAGMLEVLGVVARQSLLQRSEWEEMGFPTIPAILRTKTTDRELRAALIGDMASLLRLGIEGSHAVFAQALTRLQTTIEALWEPRQIGYPFNDVVSSYSEALALALRSSLEPCRPSDAPDGVLRFAEVGEAPFRSGVSSGHPVEEVGGELIGAVELEAARAFRVQCLNESLPMCEFPRMFDPISFESTVFSMVTAVDMNEGQMWEAADRVWNLQRAIAIRHESRTRRDDVPTEVVAGAHAGGQHRQTPGESGLQVRESDVEALKDRYYALVGWDNENGWPTRETLERLDMASVADGLEREGLLGEVGPEGNEKPSF